MSHDRGRRDDGPIRDGGAAALDRPTADPDRSPPPFTCDLPPATPILEPRHWLHPREPLAGQTVTLSVQSGNTKPAAAPQLSVEHLSRAGSRSVTVYELAGGAKAIYHIAVAGMAPGENCLVVRRGTAVELAVKVLARSPVAGAPRGNGVWKVTRNHQRRCDEQPTYGNLLHVVVRDENGAPVQGATVSIRWPDDVVYPVKPDETAQSWAAHQHPKSMTTGADGRAELWTPWGEGIRSPIDAKPGYLVFLLSVDGGASDVATEISTGIWEANAAGCNYCSTYGINVYGHWSYTVEFKRDPTATQICEVPTDHEGQQKCGYNHFYHEPGHTSCLPVAP